MSAILDFLSKQLSEGEFRLGQVLVTPGIHLRHIEDAAKGGLARYFRPEDAREIAKTDDAGAFRPLKPAPNLAHGWLIELDAVEDLRLALDFFYPAAIGTWLAYRRGNLKPVSLRETLGRQTGMYRVTRRITDGQADDLVRATCDPITGCLRRNLWEIAPGRPSPLTESQSEIGNPDGVRDPIPSRSKIPEIPILCAEACNLLVAAARPIGKGNPPRTDS